MIEVCCFGRSSTSLRNFWDGRKGSIFLASCTCGDAWNICVCKAFVLVLKALNVAVLLIEKIQAVPFIILNALGRRPGTEAVPLTASFASVSASLFPGIPKLPGYYSLGSSRVNSRVVVGKGSIGFSLCAAPLLGHCSGFQMEVRGQMYRG